MVHANVDPVQINALRQFYNATGGSHWKKNDNWLQGDPCIKQWYGVSCDATTLKDLNLFNNKLNGTIPSTIGFLTALQYLKLNSNQLSGTIPWTIGSLTALQTLSLGRNQLSGTIHSTIDSLTALQILDLHYNQLNGTISSTIGSLTALTELYLSGNQLRGTIPSTIGSLTALQTLYVNNNQLSGTIPSTINSLTTLIDLNLMNNQLSRTVPTCTVSTTRVIISVTILVLISSLLSSLCYFWCFYCGYAKRPTTQQPQYDEIPTTPQKNTITVRCCDNLDSNVRVPLAPYILLDSSESPVPFKDAVLRAYEGVSISNYLNSYIDHGERAIFEKLVHSGTTITLPEFLSVYFYTLEWNHKDLNTYSRLNKSLISENREVARPWRFYLHYLFGALRKIPKWECCQDLYRGVSLNVVENYPDKYIIGNCITWYSFTSTTTNITKIKNFLTPNKPRTIFTINGVFSGRPIQEFSSLPDESEILIPPGSRFEIVGITKFDEDSNTTTIQLKQVPSIEQLNLE